MPVWFRFNLRLPMVVHSELVKAAKANDRSVNAEIVDRLNRSAGGLYTDPEELSEADVLNRLSRLEARVDRLEKKGKKR